MSEDGKKWVAMPGLRFILMAILEPADNIIDEWRSKLKKKMEMYERIGIARNMLSLFRDMFSALDVVHGANRFHGVRDDI